MSEEICIGDIIEISKDMRIPADIVILKSYEKNEGVFIRTDQLDGETDWKLRKPLAFTQSKSEKDITLIQGYLKHDIPNKMIYDFQGLGYFKAEDKIVKEAINLENTLWQNTVMATKGGLGIVVQTGKETKAQMNNTLPVQKCGILDLELNLINKILCALMILMSAIILFSKGFSSNWLINLYTFMRFIVLLCSIIPISLRVNLDISKTINSHYINNSHDLIPDTIARNSMIPEELGRIEYLFSDKTGTLTQNEMIFKKVVIRSDAFSTSEEEMALMKAMLLDHCKEAKAPMLDLLNKQERLSNNRVRRRNRGNMFRDAITAMGLCNNVTPVRSEPEQEPESLQASSPDEIALVKFSTELGMKLWDRNENEIVLINANGVAEKYTILNNFPFTSERKRMGIILKNQEFGHIIFYLKGAESIIARFVKQDAKEFILETCETLASSGLRTLVLTQRLVSDEEYEDFIQRYKEAGLASSNRKEQMNAAIESLEKDMELLCVTGVEDLLQENVADTIEHLRNAGLKVWMLTGDKVETATCIAISTKLKKLKSLETILYIRDNPNKEYIEKMLTKFNPSINDIVIIDGECLEICINELEKLFFEQTMKCDAVVCCRCSPTQKAIVVRTMKKYTPKRVAAIGDGGNDVSMILEANLGIGIVGKEGKQASLAADYSITRFDRLNGLLFWYGRLAYKNTACISHFVIHRGLIISFIQYIFSIIFYGQPIPIYNGNLILGYTSIYTALPVISILLDMDVPRQIALKFPNLYKNIQKGRELSIKTFLIWFTISVYQAAVIMVGSIYFFMDEFYLKIVTVSFTSLIMLELLNVYAEVLL